MNNLKTLLSDDSDKDEQLCQSCFDAYHAWSDNDDKYYSNALLHRLCTTYIKDGKIYVRTMNQESYITKYMENMNNE